MDLSSLMEWGNIMVLTLLVNEISLLFTSIEPSRIMLLCVQRSYARHTKSPNL
jgi:hypothetical protein